MEYIISEEEEWTESAGALLKRIGQRRKVTFTGEIGAGKTTFIQAICRELGIEEEVTSPSFALINEYPLPQPLNGTHLVRHIDLYRLEQPQEAWEIGLDEYLHDDQFCFIEWPQVLTPWLPAETEEVLLEVLPNSDRKIIFL
jgi:tRNA threonylcarbamoyladenosine biosynthesis protein TsaE